MKKLFYSVLWFGLLSFQMCTAEADQAASLSLTPEKLLESSLMAGEYLLRHQDDHGKFNYQYHPESDTYAAGYNLLRHAGTCYALVQLYEVSHDERYLKAAQRGIELLLSNVKAPLPKDASAEFKTIVVHEGTRGSLGGSALGVLLLTEYFQAAGHSGMLAEARQLGKFLLFQQAKSGPFRINYHYEGIKDETEESLYYPGEATLALMRLYEADRDPKWLNGAEGGAWWLITFRDVEAARKTPRLPNYELANIQHDHWLLMALNELYSTTQKPVYLKYGRRIADAILGWVANNPTPTRSTPAAIRGEGLTAAYFMTLEAGKADEKYLAALKQIAEFLLRCQITAGAGAGASPAPTEEIPHPERALGGFRQSLSNPTVRIDYVQHAISALLGLREILLEQEP